MLINSKTVKIQLIQFPYKTCILCYFHVLNIFLTFGNLKAFFGDSKASFKLQIDLICFYTPSKSPSLYLHQQGFNSMQPSSGRL